MKSIVFFNNKGGVGKTTLACNVVSFLNQHKGKRVLLIDADPQCNATQAVLSDETCEAIYLDGDPKQKTLFDYLSPIEAGEVGIEGCIVPLLGTGNGFGTDIIPGHPKMSFVEDKLSSAWGELRSGTPSGYRITNWCSQLFDELEDRYDYVVFDVGPSLGALNRTVILSADFLVTPFGCDIFSLLGIRNISSWIAAWKRQYDKAIRDAREERPEILDRYPVVKQTDTKFRFIGYSVQQYVTRTFKTGRRPVKAYEKIMSEIPTTVSEELSFLKPEQLSPADVELGDIPFLFSLIPLSQANRVPIHALKESGKLVGNQFQQVANYWKLIDQLTDKLLANMDGFR